MEIEKTYNKVQWGTMWDVADVYRVDYDVDWSEVPVTVRERERERERERGSLFQIKTSVKQGWIFLPWFLALTYAYGCSDEGNES